MEIIAMVGMLIGIALVRAVCFYLLTGKAASLRESLELVCAATGLNKLLFPGTGFVAASYLSRNKNIQFSKAFGAFLILELMSVSLWLLSGVYFGVKLALRLPLGFLIVPVLLGVFAWWKRARITSGIKNIFSYWKEIKGRILLIVPLIIIEQVLLAGYYFFIFSRYDFRPDFLSLVRIVSVSFSMGYLSPSPTGLGFKDTSLVLLLQNAGLTLYESLAIAFYDRLVMTVFWALAAGMLGFDIVREEIQRRFFKKHDK